MARNIRLSLATKCQLLFGAAVILILAAALSVVWLQLETLVHEGPRKRARDIAELWLADRIQLGSALAPADASVEPLAPEQERSLVLIGEEELDFAAESDPFLAEAIEIFRGDAESEERFEETTDAQGAPYFRYARAVRRSDLLRIGGGAAAGFAPTVETPNLFDPLTMVLFIQIRDEDAARTRTLNRIYVVAAGLFAGLLAIGVFWFVTTRLILSPVRVLRQTAESVAGGDLNIRADVNTGDEFERLGDVFNDMLDTLQENQQELKRINKSLDMKLGELAEHNVALYEADKMKGEFLANVSHELRTPLNSMIGFAEVLQETLADRTGPVDEKRKRYVQHIITSSRRLLELINDLLDLAKIEAGRMEIRRAPVSLPDLIEGLVSLIGPQARERGIHVRRRVPGNLPTLETDPLKLQQILFNFLSNAVKFSPADETVTVSAQVLPPEAPGDEGPGHVQISVQDRGPGIPPEHRQKIFEKFTQLEGSVTREHEGTGLGLAISRELAELLQGRIEVESAPGRGTTFSLVLPLVPESHKKPLMPTANAA